jgi:hypothetical protein
LVVAIWVKRVGVLPSGIAVIWSDFVASEVVLLGASLITGKGDRQRLASGLAYALGRLWKTSSSCARMGL